MTFVRPLCPSCEICSLKGQHVAEGFRELDDGRVLKFHSYSGRGKTSGMEIGQMGAKGADLFEIHNGKVIRLVIYFDRAHALADLGLEK